MLLLCYNDIYNEQRQKRRGTNRKIKRKLMRCNMRWQRLNQYMCINVEYILRYSWVFAFLCVYSAHSTHSSQSSIDKRERLCFDGVGWQSTTKPNSNKGRPRSNRNRYLSAYKTGFIATLFDKLISKKSDAIL